MQHLLAKNRMRLSVYGRPWKHFDVSFSRFPAFVLGYAWVFHLLWLLTMDLAPPLCVLAGSSWSVWRPLSLCITLVTGHLLTSLPSSPPFHLQWLFCLHIASSFFLLPHCIAGASRAVVNMNGTMGVTHFCRLGAISSVFALEDSFCKKDFIYLF